MKKIQNIFNKLINESLSELKSSYEKREIESIKEGIEKVNQVFQKISEDLYSQKEDLENAKDTMEGMVNDVEFEEVK